MFVHDILCWCTNMCAQCLTGLGDEEEVAGDLMFWVAPMFWLEIAGTVEVIAPCCSLRPVR